MLKRIIRNIRQKPKHVRDNFAFILAGGLTGLIFLIWIYHLPIKMAFLVNDSEPEAEKTSFSNFVDKVGDQFSEDLEQVGDVAPEDKDLSVDNVGTTSDSEYIFDFTVSSSSSSSDPALELPDETSTSSTPVARSIRIITTGSSASSSSREAE